MADFTPSSNESLPASGYSQTGIPMPTSNPTGFPPQPGSPLPSTAGGADSAAALAQQTLQNVASSPHEVTERFWQIKQRVLREVYRLDIE